MFLSPVCQQELIYEINKLGDFYVSGIENFPSEMVKLSCNFCYKPLTYICKLWFSEAVAPRALNISKVIPVFKKGNYRLLYFLDR